jgi:hypothetical protein
VGRPTLLRLGDGPPSVCAVSAGGVAIVLVVVAAIGVTLFVGRGSGGPSSETFVLGATAESTATPAARRSAKSRRARRSRVKRDNRETPSFAPRKRAKPKRATPASTTPAKPGTAQPATNTPADGKPAGDAPAQRSPSGSGPGGSDPAGGAPAPAPPLGTGVPGALSPEAFIKRYYSALNDRRFAAAWRSLGPGVRASFGGFDFWQRGFTRSVASVPTEIEVTRGPGGATVSLTLRAGDRAPCGDTVVRRYAVTWRLARTDAGWLATAASGRPAGADPGAAC